ncbi:GTP 3',8-cyclase MoaA [Corynebacterium diphtheriae]|uniref:GTP 3',8-cyclase MoaA n=1 Tax=Corynebacterium diphtheriae TaxID=1717 RepID=UPI00024695CA|nr:GTP 3',8-cyclase MoaA [Corynebacterium diphtheriae]AEX69157.1 molybdenum cofactor biosynthesis protein A [Corynebacterium diphtheriae PW8]OKY24501.1 cyclic pyranopterin phosphate synthase MoaA [Corynebacterium diphtheriae]UEB39010.1 GTP 3',8-cyclase MoaA [Corynebacterium diphtheriae]CAB0585501.1 GTP 3',8-cyclase MoaA [Corynebacterium diphtheriae]SUY73466.1 molybdenum cofactor biosynthesis protein A [Corynebacterium diphtheriae bv. mitis]
MLSAHSPRPRSAVPSVQLPSYELVDEFGRQATDLRVSLTDKCNLRCTYCMPEEGLHWMPTPDVLTDDEVIRLVTIAVTRLSVRSIRFTGGEPLLRKSLEDIISATSSLTASDGSRPSIALTTNGLGLDKRMHALVEAGLDRINISLDSLHPQTYFSLSRRDRLDSVLAGIDAAIASGISPIKINTVIMPGINEDEIVPLAKFCLSRGLQLRFIEQMPIGAGRNWDKKEMITAEDIIGALSKEISLTASSQPRGHAPAELWKASYDDFHGHIGVIAAVTKPFCAGCDRTRLTADGAVRNCLFANEEVSLRDLMRHGATDDDIVAAWRLNAWDKKRGHGINQTDFIQPTRTMSAIGG